MAVDGHERTPLILSPWTHRYYPSLLEPVTYATLGLELFGPFLAFLYGWARLAVIQTGSIALLAFVFGDYASQLLPLGPWSSSVYAVAVSV